jgi:hypothetical protein
MKMKVCVVVLLLLLIGWLASVQLAVATANALIQNDSMFVGSSGYLRICGEVKNVGDLWLRFVKITGTLRDSSNAIVDIVSTSAVLDFVPPGIAAPFCMFERDTAKIGRVRSYSLVVEFQEGTALSQKLAVLNVANSTELSSVLRVFGEVQNQGEAPSEWNEVLATFYDAAGKVVYVDTVFTNHHQIPPGGVDSFELAVFTDDLGSEITRYSLMAQSDQYTSVPEFPWGTIIAAVTLTLTVVVLKREKRKQSAVSQSH